MTADEIQKLAVAALEAFNEALSDAESCGHPLNGPGASVRAFKSRQEAWDALATLRDAALRTAEPSPEVNVEARGLPPLPQCFQHPQVYGAGWMLYTADQMQAYAHAALAAQADARREDGAMLDHLQRTGSTVELVPGGHGGHFFRIGGLHKAVHANLREAIRAAMNTTNGADHAE